MISNGRGSGQHSQEWEKKWSMRHCRLRCDALDWESQKAWILFLTLGKPLPLCMPVLFLPPFVLSVYMASSWGRNSQCVCTTPSTEKLRSQLGPPNTAVIEIKSQPNIILRTSENPLPTSKTAMSCTRWTQWQHAPWLQSVQDRAPKWLHFRVSELIRLETFAR